MNDLNFNIYNIIIIAGVIHGFIFSLIILINKNLKSFTNNFLAFTILSLSLSNLQYWLIDTNIIPRYFYENNTVLYLPFEFLMLPFFYFFVKSFIQQKVLKKHILYIFTPFLFSIIYLMLRNTLSSEILIVKFLNIIVGLYRRCLLTHCTTMQLMIFIPYCVFFEVIKKNHNFAG
mgnify:CR=1 FL=1